MKQIVNHNIDELLVKLLAGEATPDEEQEAVAWMESSEDNQHYFYQLSLIWNESHPSQYTNDVDENAAWNTFIKAAAPAKPVVHMKWLKIAAAAVLIAVSWGIIYFITKDDKIVSNEIVINSFQNVTTDTLPDQSVITLNKKSSLSYPAVFAGKERRVSLKGEAFFNVSPDKAKPFIIDAGNIAVKVVGTSFNVKSNDTVTEIIVSSGIVQVMRGDEIIELKKGERTEIIPVEKRPMEKSSSNDQLFNYYVSKTFVCDNTPLWKLAEKLNTAYDVNISIPGKETRGLPVTVTFHEESLDAILDILSQTFMLKVIRNGNNIVLQ